MQTPSYVSSSLTVKKRNGQQVPFFDVRIFNAIEAAFKAHLGIPQESELDSDSQAKIKQIAGKVVAWCETEGAKGSIVFIEDIQNTVVRELQAAGFEDISKEYDNYRREHEMRRFEHERLTVKKRDGRVVSFKPEKITIALAKAFAACKNQYPLQPETQQSVLLLSDKVVNYLKNQYTGVHTIDIEEIQDIVELSLMETAQHDVARDYIVYREKQRQQRFAEANEQAQPLASLTNIRVAHEDGSTERLDVEKLKLIIAETCHGLEDKVSVEEILKGTVKNCFNGIKESQLTEAMLLATRVLIEKEPAYSSVAARILLRKLYAEVVGRPLMMKDMKKEYATSFVTALTAMVKFERLSPDLLEFDLEKIGAALKPERDLLFGYIGLQTLYDRYFIHEKGRRLETPQSFWMRVAMGLSLVEGKNKTERAIQFYEVLSSFRFVSSTPTLFNAGTLHSQLSSCFLTTVDDDLDHIFKCVKDNAQLSKWSGGLGNDWTRVRGMGSIIKGTNGRSQGLVPFLKVANDTAVAVNQGGKRKGAVCAYLECWHIDVEDFLELRKNTGDDRRRTHDMHTANWIPDLFMKRVLANEDWTLFSPNEAKDLHDTYGKDFEARYVAYEEKAARGEIALFKKIPAVQLWRKMLTQVFETGHPWITFKDPSNIRSPQDHAGVVHSSNLCTEILLNTSNEETAVCNLGSINLAAHTTESGLNQKLLADTVETAMRMLDNVIDINFYPTIEAKNANLRHRPVGLGIMGFQDALYIQAISYASQAAVDFADASMEAISYYAILGSSKLAKEKGTYGSYKGSKWDRGMLPIDTIQLLKDERGGYLDMDTSSRLDWKPVREHIKQYGMRNSNCMAIAPTATIGNIAGVTQSIEPMYKHIYVKSNLSGEFTIANPYLVDELKALGLWDQQMIDDLKYFDGNLQEIGRIPESIKERYLTAFEISHEWIIECASRRQKWIDMGQSLNLYMEEPNGKRLSQMYQLAWTRGLKTTYYLRSLGATRIEKSTLDANKYGDPLGRNKKPEAPVVDADAEAAARAKMVCSIENGPDCEACQ